jgi:hypothetical protein
MRAVGKGTDEAEGEYSDERESLPAPAKVLAAPAAPPSSSVFAQERAEMLCAPVAKFKPAAYLFWEAGAEYALFPSLSSRDSSTDSGLPHSVPFMHVVNAFRTVESTNGRLKIVELLTNMFR